MFILIYLFFFIVKFAVLKDADLIQFRSPLLIANIVEALVWFSIFRARYQHCNIALALYMLPICHVFYTGIPLTLLLFEINPFPFGDEVIVKTLCLQSLMSTHLWLAVYLLFSPPRLLKLSERLHGWISSLRVSREGLWILTFSGIALSLLYVANYYLSGVSEIAAIGSRDVLAQRAETGKTWLMQYAFSCWIIAFSLIYLSANGRKFMHASHLCLAAVALIIFLNFYLAIGNRRELVIVFLAFVLMANIYNKRRIAYYSVLAMVPVLMYKGVTRQMTGSSTVGLDNDLFYINLFGEFVFPHFPLMSHVASNIDNLYGWSYFRLPAYLFPSFGFWEKAPTLASIFAHSYSSGAMGYAYTPLAEGYLNFGFLAIFVVPVLMALTLRILTKFSYKYPVIFFSVFTLPLDMNRGEFVSIAFQVILFFFLISAFVKSASFGKKAHRDEI